MQNGEIKDPTIYVQRFRLEFSKKRDQSKTWEERTFCKTPEIFTEAFCTPDKADRDSRYDIKK